MTRTQNRNGYLRSVAAIACALLLPVGVYFRLGVRIDHTARNAYLSACAGENEVRAQVVAFIDSTVTRSERALRATLASPSSSPDQKQVAEVNLRGLKVIQRDAHRTTRQKRCVYPVTMTPDTRPHHTTTPIAPGGAHTTTTT